MNECRTGQGRPARVGSTGTLEPADLVQSPLSLSFLICEVGVMTLPHQAAVSDRKGNANHVSDTGPGTHTCAGSCLL